METSSSITSIGPAFLKAQMKIGVIVKDQEAKIPTRSGGNFSYAYADINTVLEVCMPALNENGIFLMQPPASEEGGQIFVETLLIHASSGEFFSARMPIAVKPGADAQAVGSGITYVRRYILLAMLGLRTEDDDGAAAVKDSQQQRSNGNGNNQQQTASEMAFNPQGPLPAVNVKDTNLSGLVTRDQMLAWIKYHGPMRSDGNAATYDDVARYVMRVEHDAPFDPSALHPADRANVQNFLRKLRTQR